MRTWVAAGTAAVLLLGLPERALASLDGSSSSSSAVARFTGDDDGPTITSLPDSLSLTLSSAASETYTPAFGPWLDNFEYQATILGAGTVTYGSAAGEIQGEASATPEFVAPGQGNLNGPESNQDSSTVHAVMHLAFQEEGVVTGGVAGTPVVLTLNFSIQSVGTLIGGHPSFPRSAGAQFYGRVIDKDIGGASVERTVYGSELATVDLITAVGEVLSIEGRLSLRVEGFAGNSTAIAGFYPQFEGSVNASIAGLWMEAPPGVEIEAPSGHDYTIPVPEPGRPLLLLFGAGALFTRRLRGRRSVVGAPAS